MNSIYHIPSMCCMPRLTREIPTQQQNPVKMGFPPVLTSLMIFVFSPIAAIAMTMRNLLSSFSGAVTSAGSWNTVVTTDASTKNKTKNGKERFRLKEEPSAVFSFLPLQMARISVIGMIASVLVIFTMAADSNVLLPWMPSHAAAAAVTEEVSLIAVPANIPKPSLLQRWTAPLLHRMHQ